MNQKSRRAGAHIQAPPTSCSTTEACCCLSLRARCTLDLSSHFLPAAFFFLPGEAAPTTSAFCGSHCAGSDGLVVSLDAPLPPEGAKLVYARRAPSTTAAPTATLPRSGISNIGSLGPATSTLSSLYTTETNGSLSRLL